MMRMRFFFFNNYRNFVLITLLEGGIELHTDFFALIHTFLISFALSHCKSKLEHWEVAIVTTLLPSCFEF